MYRAGLLLAAASMMLGAPAIHAQNADPDIAACNNVSDLNARVAGCSRLLSRRIWPAKTEALLYLQRAQGYARLHQLERALQDYEATLRYDPKSVAAYSDRALLYNQLGDPDRALLNTDQALRLNPNYAVAYAARGAALLLKGQSDAAIAVITKSIALDPKQQQSYLVRATALASSGEMDRAIADLDTAIKLDPQQAVAYNNRCWAWTQKGELDNALADCNQALRISPDYGLAYSNRGIAWFQKGDLENALSDFSRSIRIDPSYWAGFAGRGDVWRKKGDLQRALADFQEAIKLSPRAVRSYVSEGLVFEAEGQIDKARAAFKAALDLPANVVVSGAMGAVFESFRREQDTARARLVALNDAPAAQTGPLFAASPAPQPAAPPSLGRRIALVIGNGAYANAPQLTNPVNDARAIAQNLRGMGFEVSDGLNLDRAAMTKLIGDFLRAAATANTAVMFYAGHGVQIDGRNYLLPIDVRFNGVANLTSEMTDVNTILAGLDDGIRANIIILDACRNNPLVQAAQPASSGRAVAVPTGLAPPSNLGRGATSGAGTLLAFATAPGEVALDGEGADSPFSLALSHHIGTPGLEVQQMLTRVRAEVVTTTRGKQVPWSNSSLLGELYLAGKP
jgi:tetratricopeptide (TPR) repeat protein